MKKVPLSEVKGRLSEYLRLAQEREIVITRNGQPAGVLKGFTSEDDWFEYQLLNDPRFIKRVEEARKSLREGKGRPLDDVMREIETKENARKRRRARK